MHFIRDTERTVTVIHCYSPSIVEESSSLLHFLLLLTVHSPLLLPSVREQGENTSQDFRCTCLLNASVRVCKCVCMPVCGQVCMRPGVAHVDVRVYLLGLT